MVARDWGGRKMMWGGRRKPCADGRSCLDFSGGDRKLLLSRRAGSLFMNLLHVVIKKRAR